MLAQEEYPVRPVPFADVRFTDSFWAPRLETNRTVSIPGAFAKCEENARMDNFLIAAGTLEGEHKGSFPFDDTDPYKILEGASYSLAVHPDAELEAYLDALIEMIAAAQEEDGYLYTARTNNAEHLKNWYGDERWEKLAGSHELYNAGHMYEAAVAHFLATGKRTFLDVAIKNADLIAATFGPGKVKKPPGHQVIEIGLAKLFRVTGDEKYLRLAKFLLDERGRAHGRELGGQYNQDHLPVVEQTEAVGHAVRASYMYAGMADVAALTGDQEYLRAIDILWEDVVTRKMHITGGIGARSSGEAFGDAYELPNFTAYNETCAAIGNAMWNHRLFLLHADSRYIDVLERVLYNGGLSGVSLSGDRFFYPNPLESRGNHERSPWFGCACCPGNVTRFIPSIPGFAYAHAGDRLYVNLYVQGGMTVELEGGKVSLEQTTNYPFEGDVRIVVETDPDREFTICLRIPGWARGVAVPEGRRGEAATGALYRFQSRERQAPTIRVNGKETDVKLERGFALLRRSWKSGDSIDLRMEMPVERIFCHEKVEENLGKVALQRGPIVYCVEWPDVQDGHVLNLQLTDKQRLLPEHRPDLLGGVTVLLGMATAWTARGTADDAVGEPVSFMAIPYYAWAHRGRGEMAVWLARERRAVRPLPLPTVASLAKLTTSGGTNPGAINDLVEAESSIDQSHTFFHWWPKLGSLEWVQYEFAQPQSVSGIEVYWFDDIAMGRDCMTPKSWRLLYRDGDAWKPVTGASGYGTEKDRYNLTTFDPVTTGALRLEVQLQEGWSAGIHEWKVRK